MLNRFIAFICIVFLVLPGLSYARKENKTAPDPNESAYEHANEHARFKRDVNDSKKKKVKREVKKAKKKARKEVKKSEGKIGKKAKKAEKKAKKNKRKAEKEIKENLDKKDDMTDSQEK